MPIITISRQFGSLGAEIGQRLCRELRCNYLDKESLEQTFEEHGLTRENVRRFDERKPGFWDLFNTDKVRYFHYLKGAVYEAAARDNCVIMGRGGQSMLAGLPGVLHVRLFAPMDTRVGRIMQRYECDDDHARRLIQRIDRERAGFLNFFFDMEWEDLSLYDMAVNTGSFSPEAVTDMIVDVVNSNAFRMAREETGAGVADLLLGHKVKDLLLFEERIPIEFLEIIVVDGVVTLRGIVVDSSNVEHSGELVSNIDGVRKVKNELYYKPIAVNYGMHY